MSPIPCAAMRACSVRRPSLRRSTSRSSSRRRELITTGAASIRGCSAPSSSNSGAPRLLALPACTPRRRPFISVLLARRRLARLEYRLRGLLRALRRRNVLAVGHDPQHVRAGHLRDVAVAPAAAHELDQQVRILVDALEATRRIGNAVEIRAEPDVVDAGHLP